MRSTGFAIGGIPPFGHATPLATWIDEDLLQYETVWAAAGTPNAVFAVDPVRLRDAVGATVIRVTVRTQPVRAAVRRRRGR